MGQCNQLPIERLDITRTTRVDGGQCNPLPVERLGITRTTRVDGGQCNPLPIKRLGHVLPGWMGDSATRYQLRGWV